MLPMDKVFTNILVILLYVVIGFVSGKIKLINPDQRKYLTRLCSDLILPFTILSASRQTLDATAVTNLGFALAVMFAVFGGTMSVSLLVFGKQSKPAVRAAGTSLVTFSNCTFLGLPLCQSLFPEIAVLYGVAALLAFNVLFFTVQYTLFTGEKFKPKNLVTPAMVSTVILLAMLFTGVRFPDPVQTVVDNVGAMVSPLTLIIIGVMMSESDLLAVLKEKRAYIVTLLRNFVIPVVAACLLLLVPMDANDRLCVLVYIATPCATLTSIYAIRNNMEPELCARATLMSTIFFAASLPVVIAFGNWLFV